jgi:glycosyltransferase involved in cell wall biosynthesis
MTLIHLWFPNIFEFKGGIQVYSAFLLRALQELYPDVALHVFLKHDRKSPPPRDRAQVRYTCAGTVPMQLRTVLYSAQLTQAAFQERPDLIILSHANFGVLAAPLKRWLGIPFWTIAHGTEVWNIHNRAKAHSLRQADRILAVSHYTRDRLLAEEALPPEQIGLLPNTFERDRFQPGPKPPHLLARYGLRSEQPVLLTVARLDALQPYKGYDQLLYALLPIREAVPDVHYLIVGTGSDRDRVERLITQLHLQACVTLTGFVPDAELCDHYNLCDVFAMPSRGEGFGIVYLEALACGKPCLGGNQDGAIDALKNGELGVLVPPEDRAQIATQLIHLLQKTHAQQQLFDGAFLQAQVEAHYGFAAFRQRLAQELDQHFFATEAITASHSDQ